MKEPKRYYCGNGEGMFEDDKNGHWVEYSEHKAIVEALGEQLRLGAVVGRSEQLKPKPQICYKSNEPCKYDCSGLCKESC